MKKKYARRRYLKKKDSKVKEILYSHIKNNFKEYLIISLIFFIGIVIGVIFINNACEEQSIEITNYITSFIEGLKNEKEIDTFLLLKDSLKKNLVLALLLWFMGSTIIGILVVYLIVCFRGFCFGYTISSIILSLGISKGILFIFLALFLQYVIFIPCILALSVSGMKLHNSIMKDRGRENIKIEILRHTMFSLVMTVFLALSSFVEVYISKNILLSFIKYI